MGLFKMVWIWTPILISLIFLRPGRGAVLLNDLFPFNTGQEHEYKFCDDCYTEVNFTRGFNFFNATYNSTFLSGNGQVSFGRGISTYTPNCSASGTPMIMAYWSDSYYDDKCQLLFRESREPNHLKKAATDVFLAFPNLKGISLSWMFIVTWKNVPFYGANATVCDGKSKRNTYQLVLTTDGYYTFALMYYNRIDWTTGRARSTGGDCRGLGGKPAKAGFDYGDGKTLYTVPGSCTDSILNIPGTSNINQPGKWVFRVESNLETSTCDDFTLATNRNLKLNPNVVSYVGLQALKIDGPCLKRRLNAKAICIFHDKNITHPIRTEVEGKISADFQEVLCPLPFFHEVGRKKVELKVSYPSGATRDEDIQISSGYIYALDDTSWGHHLNISFEQNGNENDIIMSATWDPQYFNDENNDTPSRVNIKLKTYDGYKWNHLGVLSSSLENSGRFTGSIKKKVLENWSKMTSQGMPFFIMSAPGAGRKLASKLFTGFRCLSNLFLPGFPISCGETELFPRENAFPCPPTLELAEIDQNFEEDEETSKTGVNSIKRQKISSGGASKCVYDQAGHLMAIPPNGTVTAEKYSPQNIPLHFFHDVVPNFICNRNKTYPTDTGNKYQRRRFARATGDPHIAKFDGFTYTFNGLGEFWLVKLADPDFKMQARMEQYVSSTGEKKNASIITAVSMEEVARNGEKVRIQIISAQKKIIVVVDGIQIDVEAAQLFKDFCFRHKSCSIKIKKSSSSQAETVIVTFESSFSFQFSTVSQSEAALNIIGSANSNILSFAEGLFGGFNEESGGDDENISMGRPDDWQSSTTTEEMHRGFGMPWMIREQHESLFSYRPGESLRTFNKPDFVPRFEIDRSQSLPQTVRNTCGEYNECIFDYVTTGSVGLATGTRESIVEYESLVKTAKKEVEMCPTLQNPERCHLTWMTNAIAGVGKMDFECGNQPLNCSCTLSENDRPRWKCGVESPPQKHIKPLVCKEPTLDNGNVIGTNYSVGASIQLTCINQNRLFWKNRKVICPGGAEQCPTPKFTCVEEENTLENGTGVIHPVWRGPGGKEIKHVKCVGLEDKTKFCNRSLLLNPEHGFVRLSDLATVAGVKAEFSCETGYQLEETGMKNCTCWEDGSWGCNVDLPAKCVEKRGDFTNYHCDNPLQPGNGTYINGTNYSVGSSVSLECNDGNTAENFTCVFSESEEKPVWKGNGGRIMNQIGCWSISPGDKKPQTDQQASGSSEVVAKVVYGKIQALFAVLLTIAGIYVLV